MLPGGRATIVADSATVAPVAVIGIVANDLAAIPPVARSPPDDGGSRRPHCTQNAR